MNADFWHASTSSAFVWCGGWIGPAGRGIWQENEPFPSRTCCLSRPSQAAAAGTNGPFIISPTFPSCSYELPRLNQGNSKWRGRGGQIALRKGRFLWRRDVLSGGGVEGPIPVPPVNRIQHGWVRFVAGVLKAPAGVPWGARLTSWCTAESRRPWAAAACSAWSCCAQWISSRWGRRCPGSRCYWPAGYSGEASPSGPWSKDARPSSFGGRTRRSCIPARANSESRQASALKRVRTKEAVTISVSETGPKLVTKMLVLISVTFSVNTKEHTSKETPVNCEWIHHTQ